MTYEFALVCQRRWREQLGLHFRIALEQDGSFVDEDTASPSSVRWNHVDYFITTDELADVGYPVLAVRTPAGNKFCLKFTNLALAAQSVFVDFEEGPAAAVEKARRMGFLDLEPPKPSPFRAQHEAEKQKAAQQATNARFANMRPGDRER